jgi:hypothetical protein
VARSSDKGTIRSGQDWKKWIDEQIVKCDVAIVLLTPASLRGRWVLWEAGAVAGVQFERLSREPGAGTASLSRRVRVVYFNLVDEDLGPFAGLQARRGQDSKDMESFIIELMMEYRPRLRMDDRQFGDKLASLRADIHQFVTQVTDDLRYTPIRADEGVVQEWLSRLDMARTAKDDRWIVAAKRWINVAFLGAGRADAHLTGEVVDFRIHTRLAEAHARLQEWPESVEQLKLAATLSPNDIVILRSLGRAQREAGLRNDLEETLSRMEQVDPDVFRRDREGITLRCGYLSKLPDWPAVERLLSDAEPSIVSSDPYLMNWRAIATMKTQGPEKSSVFFRLLEDLLKQLADRSFWDSANLVNALLARDKKMEAATVLLSLGLNSRSPDEVKTATKFYDDILMAFDHEFDWRKAAGLT